MRIHIGRRSAIALGVCAILLCAGASGATWAALSPVYFSTEHLPDPGPLERFEFPTIGRVYDTNGQAIIELARERRQITP